MLDYINPIAFFISLFIGFLVAYSIMPQPKIIVKYPTPENAGKVIYMDNKGVCYKYTSKEVKCKSKKENSKNKT